MSSLVETSRIIKDIDNILTENTENITIRFLESYEYYKLEEVYRENGGELPHPNLSKILIAETQEEKIVGFATVGLEPMVVMWIDNEYRHNHLWAELVSTIYPLTQNVKTYVVATKIETQEMCERLGLRKLEYPVYVKDR